MRKSFSERSFSEKIDLITWIICVLFSIFILYMGIVHGIVIVEPEIVVGRP